MSLQATPCGIDSSLLKAGPSCIHTHTRVSCTSPRLAFRCTLAQGTVRYSTTYMPAPCHLTPTQSTQTHMQTHAHACGHHTSCVIASTRAIQFSSCAGCRSSRLPMQRDPLKGPMTSQPETLQAGALYCTNVLHRSACLVMVQRQRTLRPKLLAGALPGRSASLQDIVT